MAVENCPQCGKELKKLASTGRRVCAHCGYTEKFINSEKKKVIMEKTLFQFTGGAVTNTYGILNPAGFGGKTTLRLTEAKVMEKTKKIISTRYCEIRVSRIDSGEITEQGISWLLVAFILFLAVYGLGIIFLILYFLIKNKYLVIYSGSNVLAVQIKGKDGLAKANQFLQMTLEQAEKIARTGSKYERMSEKSQSLPSGHLSSTKESELQSLHQGSIDHPEASKDTSQTSSEND